MGDEERGQAGLIGLGDVRDLLNRRILEKHDGKEYTLDADATQVLAEKRDARFTCDRQCPILSGVERVYADVGIFV